MYDVLVIGADGMVGGMVFNYLRDHSNVLGTCRSASSPHYKYVANRDIKSVELLLSKLSSGALVINCVAILDLGEQDDVGKTSLLESIEVNSIFPHFLAKACAAMGMRLIHISTDAVFGSNPGYFSEDEDLCPNTTYGLTKALGEVSGENVITIRCSLVGPSYSVKKGGLWNWILHAEENATIPGYTNNTWTGVTTLQFARICHKLLSQKCFFNILSVSGSLHHLCVNDQITKYDLISKIAKRIRPDLKVKKEKSALPLNRLLNTSKGGLNNLLVKTDWDNEIDAIATLYPGYVKPEVSIRGELSK